MIYINLLIAYLKIGLFGFGGGYAMLSLIQHEVVDVIHYGETQPWLTLQEFTDIVAISQMSPGPIGINSATYIGYKVTGTVLGSIIATIAELNTRFTASSITKLSPTKAVTIYAPAFSKPAPAAHSLIVSMKNSTHPSKNMPVFTTGETTPAVTTAAILFFLLIRR